MNELIVYTLARDASGNLAHSARPDAPVVEVEHGSGRRTAWRLRISVALHRLADRLEPAPACGEPALNNR